MARPGEPEKRGGILWPLPDNSYHGRVRDRLQCSEVQGTRSHNDLNLPVTVLELRAYIAFLLVLPNSTMQILTAHLGSARSTWADPTGCPPSRGQQRPG